MPRARDPNRDKAYEIWKSSNGKKKLKDIAAELGVSDTQIRKWKSQDKWEQTKGNVTKPKRNVTNKPRLSNKAQVEISPEAEINLDNFLEDSELTDKQRLFCLYYVKSFNATQSAINAGYSKVTAHVQGPRLLSNVRVRDEIKRIKGAMASELYIEAMDVLQKWVKIAFSDITDFLTFGQKDVPVIGMMGPVLDDEGRQMMKEVNYVDFKDSGYVDGTIISEVKQGKDGVSIKLEDRMKALEKLSLYFDLFPDNFKRQIEEEKLKIAHHKVFGGEDEDEYEDDGFEDALNGVTKEVWADDHSTEE
jgi:phage terminase small subunit